MYKYRIHLYIREMSTDFQQLAWGWIILELDMSREEVLRRMLVKEDDPDHLGFSDDELTLICMVLNRIRPYKHRLQVSDFFQPSP
ncbi:MAG: hypothetical protein AAF388_03460 [Bacteroidota bacterium]